MHALLVNDYRGHGGCEEVVEQTAGLLRRAGVAVSTFTSEDVAGHRRTALGYIDSHRCRAALTRKLAEVGPDVVHLHNFYHQLSPGILEALRTYRTRAPLRVVMTAHDFHLLCPSPALLTWSRGRPQPLERAARPRLRDLLTRRWDHRGLGHSTLKVVQHVWNYRMHRRAAVIDLVLCPSAFLERAFRAAGLPAQRLAHPRPPIPQVEARRPTDRLQLIFAGRVEPEKGLDLFLEAMTHGEGGGTPGFVLLVVGDGSQLDHCREIARRRGLSDRVQFLGRQDRQRTIELIASSHVLVLPSICAENAPLCLIEALSVGTSILCGNHGGQGEIVRESGVGFTYRPGDPASLREALERIERDRLGGVLNSFDARGYLTRHDHPTYVNGLLEAFAGAAAPLAVQPAHTGAAT